MRCLQTILRQEGKTKISSCQGGKSQRGRRMMDDRKPRATMPRIQKETGLGGIRL